MAHKDRERLIEMHEPRWSGLTIWLLFLGAFVLTQGLLFWSLTAGAWWAAVPLVMVLAHLMHGHLIAFHEAAHGSLCPHPRLNDALGIFIGMFSFMGFSLYRAAHHSHHSYLATERDEELWPFVLPSLPRWFRCLAAASELVLGLVYTPVLFFRAFIRRGTVIKNHNRRRRIWAELGLIGLVWVVVLALVAYFNAWKYLLVMYVIPAGLAGTMQSLRKYIEHMGLNGHTVLSSTRSVVNPGLLGRFLAFTLFEEPYHGVHHKFARLPHTVLPEFTDVLVPGEPPERAPFPTYSQALFDMLPTLLDPKVGSQWLRYDRSGPSPGPGARHSRIENREWIIEQDPNRHADHQSSILR
jgi:fatty acid desaturase